MRPRKKKKPPVARLSPAQRVEAMKLLLCSGWVTPAEAMSRLSISRATAFRLVSAIEATEPVERDVIEGKTRWRLPPNARVLPLRLSTSQMVALTFVRNALGFLRGTGMDDDLADVFDRLALALKKSDAALYENLDRKLYDRDEASYDYSDKLEVVNDVITALLREERVTLKRKRGAPVKVDPYTLVLYKKGLYLAGHSHGHGEAGRGELRTFGLDKIVDTERHVGERFEYPDAWNPAAHYAVSWGIIGGPETHVGVRFDAKVASFVTRRRWHATQKFDDTPERLVMTCTPHGTDEMDSWLLSFGSTAEVHEPKAMRARIAAELRKAAALYDDEP